MLDEEATEAIDPVRDDGDEGTMQTQVGTPAYLSPEQLDAKFRRYTRTSIRPRHYHLRAHDGKDALREEQP